MWPWSPSPRYHALSTRVDRLSIRVRGTPVLSYVAIFLAVYLLAIIIVRQASYRDPTSVFFDPKRGYDQRYSAIRVEQANAFIETATKDLSQYAPKFNTTNSHGALCVGIPSVAREGALYFRSTVGSILDGLSHEERNKIYLMVLIGHSNPSDHPAYAETWLHELPDKVLLYSDYLHGETIQHIRQLETEKIYEQKSLLDYTYVLKQCISKGMPYIVMLEDDVVAANGWYQKTVAAIDSAEEQTIERGLKEFLYLRLFYTEEFLGWNSEDWPTYWFWSMVIALSSAAVLLSLRMFAPVTRPYLSATSCFIFIGVCLPLAIGLFFAAGRISVIPMPQGVHEMNGFGCCSQGLVFPQAKGRELVEYLEGRARGFPDVLTEDYANERGQMRWALTPSILQHVGRKSSKGDDFGQEAKHDRSVAEKIWNFRFELFNPATLAKEHTWGSAPRWKDPAS